jgi:hypothetical protein
MLNYQPQLSQPPQRAALIVFRYFFLVFILALVAFDIWLLCRELSSHYPYTNYTNLAVALMLLFNHLAFQFNFSAPATRALRILAIVWMVFASAYVGWVLFHQSLPVHKM